MRTLTFRSTFLYAHIPSDNFKQPVSRDLDLSLKNVFSLSRYHKLCKNSFALSISLSKFCPPGSKSQQKSSFLPNSVEYRKISSLFGAFHALFQQKFLFHFHLFFTFKLDFSVCIVINKLLTIMVSFLLKQANPTRVQSKECNVGAPDNQEGTHPTPAGGG